MNFAFKIVKVNCIYLVDLLTDKIFTRTFPRSIKCRLNFRTLRFVVLLFYVHGKHLRSCRDGQLT